MPLVNGTANSQTYSTFQTATAELAQPVMTAAQAQAELNVLIADVQSKRTAALAALSNLEASLGNPVTSIAQLMDVLDIVRDALSLLSDLETSFQAYQDFLATYGGNLNVPARVRSDLDQLGRWLVAARERLASAEQRMLATFSDRYASRVELDIDNPIDWDESPTIYQATSIAHGHMLCYRMRWKANGYSLGELLSTFALGPCQSKQIAVLEYGREETASRAEATDYQESLKASLARDRDVNEIINASLTEKSRGGSVAASYGNSSGGGASGSGSGSYGVFKGAGGVTSGMMSSLGVSGAFSSQKSSRTVAASSMQRLRERINQSASAVRSQRSTVVQSMSQTESVKATTEVIANKNLCHSVNYMFFEVLKHYVIEQELVGAQEVLFIPLRITPFDPAKILRWREVIGDFLPSDYLRTGIQDIANLEAGIIPKAGRLADEDIFDFSGTMSLSFDLPLPDIRDPEEGVSIPSDYDFGPAWHVYQTHFQNHFSTLIYSTYFRNRLHQQRVKYWKEVVVPRLVREFIEGLTIHADTEVGRIDLGLDVSQLNRYRDGVRVSVKLSSSGHAKAIKRSDIRAIVIKADRKVPNNSRILVESMSLSYRSDSLESHIFKDNRLRNDIGNSDNVWIATPLSAEESRVPAVEQRVRANALITHLNDNLEAYHGAIYAFGIDDKRRFMMLDGIKLASAGNRSVANLVENRVVDIIGNCLAMPVAPGIRIDPIYRGVENLLDFYKPKETMEPFRISAKTGGYFMEAVMGTCSSCEELDYTKARFNGFACEDKPTAIEPISMDSRRADPGDLQAKDMPQSIVNFQNVPNAPDPAGIAGALDLLGKGDSFRDATGLAASQANALSALQRSADGADSMAKISADLTKQAFAGISDKTVDRDIARIEDQAAKGNISEDEKKELINKALGGKVKAGSRNEPMEIQEAETDQTKEIVEEAAKPVRDGAKKVKVRTTEKDGGTKEVEIEGGQSEFADFSVNAGSWTQLGTFLNPGMKLRRYTKFPPEDVITPVLKPPFDSVRHNALHLFKIPGFFLWGDSVAGWIGNLGKELKEIYDAVDDPDEWDASINWDGSLKHTKILKHFKPDNPDETAWEFDKNGQIHRPTGLKIWAEIEIDSGSADLVETFFSRSVTEDEDIEKYSAHQLDANLELGAGVGRAVKKLASTAKSTTASATAELEAGYDYISETTTKIKFKNLTNQTFTMVYNLVGRLVIKARLSVEKKKNDGSFVEVADFEPAVFYIPIGVTLEETRQRTFSK